MTATINTSDLMGPFNQDGVRVLPRAYGGCQCECHSRLGVWDSMPCCYPQPNEGLRPKLQDEIDFAALKLERTKSLPSKPTQ